MCNNQLLFPYLFVRRSPTARWPDAAFCNSPNLLWVSFLSYKSMDNFIPSCLWNLKEKTHIYYNHIINKHNLKSSYIAYIFKKHKTWWNRFKVSQTFCSWLLLVHSNFLWLTFQRHNYEKCYLHHLVVSLINWTQTHQDRSSTRWEFLS